MAKHSYLSPSGALVTAFGSGLLLGCGYALLHPDFKERRGLRMTLGGGVFVAGLYTASGVFVAGLYLVVHRIKYPHALPKFSPAGMRRAWLE